MFGKNGIIKSSSIITKYKKPESFKVVDRCTERIIQYITEGGKLEQHILEQLGNKTLRDFSELRFHINSIQDILEELENQIMHKGKQNA